VKAESFPVLGAYIQTIDAWLEQDMREPRKQRHTAKRIFERLRDERGYRGGYGSVKRYVCRKKLVLGKGALDGCLPLAHPPAHAQIDFGKFKYYGSAGESHKGYALIVSFPCSNAGWIQVFPSENQECLLEGLKRIFAHIGGAPLRVRCDNMTTAVAQVLRGHERVVTDGFRRFLLHYRMEAEFCNPASGNEKGNVENKVGYTRRNLLVPVPTIEDWEAFNSTLLERCDADHDRAHYQQGEKISALWEAERAKLLTLPEYGYEAFRYESFAVSKTGFVTVDTNKWVTNCASGTVFPARLSVQAFRRNWPGAWCRRKSGSTAWSFSTTTIVSVSVK
jgi:transposase